MIEVIRFQIESSSGRQEMNPPLTADLAEVVGLNIGDGGVYRYFWGRKNYSSIVAFTASAGEYWYYESFVKPTIDRAFSLSSHLYLRSDNTTRLTIGSKKLVDYLVSLGLPIGKKIDVSIPTAILDQGFVVPFIRGFYHAEGSIYRRYSKMYNRMRKVYDNLLTIQIRTKLKTLMNQLREELMKLGIRPNRLLEAEGVFTLRIPSQHEIQRFLETIKPRYKLRPRSITL
jgi:intein/homing endonuclease